MGFYCERYEKENLWYFISTSLGECARCITIYSLYSLFISKDKQKKVQEEKQRKRLEITYLEAELMKSKLELLEVKEVKYLYTNYNLIILDF